MDAKFVNPIVDAFIDVMPQMGFPMPKRLRVYLQDRNLISNGVVLTVSFTKQMQGKVIYNMTSDTARYVASTMMFGVPVTNFNDMAQSALREVSNVLTARTATNFTKFGIEEVDITPPEIFIEEDKMIKVSGSPYLAVEMELGDHKMEVAIAVEQDA